MLDVFGLGGCQLLAAIIGQPAFMPELHGASGNSKHTHFNLGRPLYRLLKVGHCARSRPAEVRRIATVVTRKRATGASSAHRTIDFLSLGGVFADGVLLSWASGGHGQYSGAIENWSVAAGFEGRGRRSRNRNRQVLQIDYKDHKDSLAGRRRK